jgi:serine phosphatase RsbU (regulator of sigma subunit)
MLKSRTAPLGIMKSLDAEELAFTAYPGDIFVMVSDGATPSKQESQRLMQYLTDTRENDTASLSESIMRDACDRGEKDDITVICGVIK